jgi:hypothetical protein
MGRERTVGPEKSSRPGFYKGDESARKSVWLLPLQPVRICGGNIESSSEPVVGRQPIDGHEAPRVEEHAPAVFDWS